MNIFPIKNDTDYQAALAEINKLMDTEFDKVHNTKSTPTGGEKVLAILKKTGYLGSMPDATDLSENYKDHLDWGNKV